MIEKLLCVECEKQIGWVDAFDLESSYFYCDECKRKGKQTKKEATRKIMEELEQKRYD